MVQKKTKKSSAKKIEHHHHVNIVNQNIQTETSRSPRKSVKRNYVTALILSIFLGWLGVDRFYVGHIGLGIFKLILAILVAPAIIVWWIIDIIMFATKKVRYVNWN